MRPSGIVIGLVVAAGILAFAGRLEISILFLVVGILSRWIPRDLEKLRVNKDGDN